MHQEIKCIRDFPPTTAHKYSEELWKQQHGDAFVIINCHASDIYYPEHWTPLSVKCAFNGKEYYKLNNATYAVSDQHFLVLNEGAEYASYILSENITESLTLNFTQSNLKLMSAGERLSDQLLLDDPFRTTNGSTNFFQKLYSYSPALSHLMQKIKLLSFNTSANHLAIQESFYTLLSELHSLNCISGHAAGTIKAKKKSTREELYRRLSIAKDFISSCYPENITLDELATICLLNPCYLLREFKKLYAITPHQFLIETRLQEAARMIRHTSKKITDIIPEVGFQDPASFSRLFKRRFGSTPGRYHNL